MLCLLGRWLTGRRAFSSNPALVMKSKLAVLAASSFRRPARAGSGSRRRRLPSPQASNSIAFPLFDSSSVLASHSFSQTVARDDGARRGLNDMLGQGAGTYDGHEVVAGTLAVMPALEVVAATT